MAAELRCVAVECDVADGATVEAAVKRAAQLFGTPRIVLNAAGIDIAVRTANAKGAHSLEEFERVIRVNPTGTFNGCRMTIHAMIGLDQINDDGEYGAIINSASVVAEDGPQSVRSRMPGQQQAYRARRYPWPEAWHPTAFAP